MLNDKIERIMKKIIEEKEVEMQKITGTTKKDHLLQCSYKQ
jgi:hypothetical protein